MCGSQWKCWYCDGKSHLCLCAGLRDRNVYSFSNADMQASISRKHLQPCKPCMHSAHAIQVSSHAGCALVHTRLHSKHTTCRTHTPWPRCQARDYPDDEYELPGKASSVARAERGASVRGSGYSRGEAAGGGAGMGTERRNVSHKAGAGLNARQARYGALRGSRGRVEFCSQG